MTHTVYEPHERPEIEVLVEGAWHYGELRMWIQHRDGSWSANVMWERAHGENRLDALPAEKVRLLAEPGAGEQ